MASIGHAPQLRRGAWSALAESSHVRAVRRRVHDRRERVRALRALSGQLAAGRETGARV
jgi:hypothetical protein